LNEEAFLPIKETTNNRAGIAAELASYGVSPSDTAQASERYLHAYQHAALR
jgi:hypothetical protein